MYLLSPEGDTVFYIPGVEVVHRAPGGLQVRSAALCTGGGQHSGGLGPPAAEWQPACRQHTTVSPVNCQLVKNIYKLVVFDPLGLLFLW